MIEYNRQEPPDVQEYYQCSACHEEEHMDDLVILDRFNEILLCNKCNPGKLHCTKCNETVVNDVCLWLACECTSREIGNKEPFPQSWSGLTPAEPDEFTLDDCHAAGCDPGVGICAECNGPTRRLAKSYIAKQNARKNETDTRRLLGIHEVFAR